MSCFMGSISPYLLMKVLNSARVLLTMNSLLQLAMPIHLFACCLIDVLLVSLVSCTGSKGNSKT